MIGNIRLNGDEIDKLGEDPGVVGELGKIAQGILPQARSRAPHWLEAQWLTRAGVSDRGGFAQAIARGSGAVLAEYGGTRSPAYAMFRSAIR